MSTISLFNTPTSFRFTRPSFGRAGASEDLHGHVAEALEELEGKLAEGFSVPDKGLEERIEAAEAKAREAEDEAADLQREAERRNRDVEEAFDVHRAAEDVAERLAAKVTEAMAEGKERNLKKLQAERDKARAVADEAKKKADEAKAAADGADGAADAALATAANTTEAARKLRSELDVAEASLIEVLGRPIYSSDETIANTLFRYTPGADPISLGEYIDHKGHTTELYKVKELLEHNRNNLDFNLRNLLSREPVVEYLFARLLFAGDFTEPESIFNVFTSPTRGGKVLYDFVVERSLVLMRDERQLNLTGEALRNAADRMMAHPVSLQEDDYEATLSSLLEEFVFGTKERKLIAVAEKQMGITIPTKYIGPLVDYIRRSNDAGEVINEANATYFISIALSKLRAEDVSLTPGAPGEDVTVQDYSVDYYQDKTPTTEYDRASIEAAAQMFLTMVWGDELGIFEVVDRIAIQSSGQQQRPLLLDVRSRGLSDALRMYVLDEEFIDLKTGRVRRRTAPAERQMFYRMLFGVGDSQVIDEMQINADYPRLWAVLMVEVVKYIGKVEENSTGYTAVSAQKVYQAIEDLQYNLSAYCTGLPKIAAPTMHAEMDFVIQRILDSNDVKEQLARRGAPSFWKVVEEVRGRQDFTPLRNKGMLGHMILSTVAGATPALLEDKTAFEEFISAVEAYIVAEDQLAEKGDMPQLPKQYPGFYGFDPQSFPGSPFTPKGGGGAIPANNGSATGNGAANGGNSDNWNF